MTWGGLGAALGRHGGQKLETRIGWLHGCLAGWLGCGRLGCLLLGRNRTSPNLAEFCSDGDFTEPGYYQTTFGKVFLPMVRLPNRNITVSNPHKLLLHNYRSGVLVFQTNQLYASMHCSIHTRTRRNKTISRLDSPLFFSCCRNTPQIHEGLSWMRQNAANNALKT